VGDVAGGEDGRRDFTVWVAADAAQGEMLTAEAQIQDAYGSEGDAKAATARVVQTDHPLRVTLSANPDPVRPGERVDYRIQVANLSALPLSSIKLEAQVPPRTEVSEGSTRPNGDCGGTANSRCGPASQIVWIVDTLLPGESREYLMSAKVDGGAPDGTLISSTALVRYTGAVAPAVAEATVVVDNAPLLRLELDAAPGPVEPAAPLVYQVVYGNRSELEAPAAVLRARAPTGTVLESASGDGLIAGNAVTWSLGDVAGGEDGLRSFSVRLDPDLDAGDVATAQAEVRDALGSEADARAATARVVQPEQPLRVTMSANPDPVRPGERVDYRIQVANLSALPLSSIKLEAQVPPRTEVSEGSTRPNGDCGGTANSSCGSASQIVWTVDTLLPGESREYLMPAKVDGGTPDGTLISSTAVVRYTEAGSPAVAEATVVVDPRPDADSDGLSDEEEIDIYGTDPQRPDSDGDGLSDGEEVLNTGTDPKTVDSDGDGLGDGVESGVDGFDADPSTQTDPLSPDSDGDGMLDGNNGTDPCEDCNNNGRVDAGEFNPQVETRFVTVGCRDLALQPGLNLVSHPRPPIGLGCYALLASLGESLAESVQRFDATSNRFESCAFDDGGSGAGIIGTDFPILVGEGYLLYMHQNALVELPGCGD
jgi:hypothetical protein